MFYSVPPVADPQNHALVMQMTRALEPFRCVDLPGLAQAVLTDAGFAPHDVADHWRAAASAVLARRRAFPGKNNTGRA